jgi:hypothetical protein
MGDGFCPGVVTGFTGITARIGDVNINSVSFKGTTTNYELICKPT